LLEAEAAEMLATAAVVVVLVAIGVRILLSLPVAVRHLSLHLLSPILQTILLWLGLVGLGQRLVTELSAQTLLLIQ